jgi:hypothetical protein
VRSPLRGADDAAARRTSSLDMPPVDLGASLSHQHFVSSSVPSCLGVSDRPCSNTFSHVLPATAHALLSSDHVCHRRLRSSVVLSFGYIGWRCRGTTGGPTPLHEQFL